MASGRVGGCGSERLRPPSDAVGLSADPIGRRFETPLRGPDRDVLVFGDAMVGRPADEGPLRTWSAAPVDGRQGAWYRGVFAPTARPLLALEPDGCWSATARR